MSPKAKALLGLSMMIAAGGVFYTLPGMADALIVATSIFYAFGGLFLLRGLLLLAKSRTALVLVILVVVGILGAYVIPKYVLAAAVSHKLQLEQQEWRR